MYLAQKMQENVKMEYIIEFSKKMSANHYKLQEDESDEENVTSLQGSQIKQSDRHQHFITAIQEDCAVNYGKTRPSYDNALR